MLQKEVWVLVLGGVERAHARTCFWTKVRGIVSWYNSFYTQYLEVEINTRDARFYKNRTMI